MWRKPWRIVALFIISVSATSAAQRFVVGGESVFDRKTGLTWMRCSVGQKWVETRGCSGVITGFTWDAARALDTGGFRLPTAQELVSIIDEARRDRQLAPKVDLFAFPGLNQGQLLWYWSSSSVGSCVDDRREGCGYYVDFGNSGSDAVFALPHYRLLPVLLVKTGAETSARSETDHVSPTRSGPFILTGGEAKDTRTGLIWQRCSVGEKYSAELGCTGLMREISLSELMHLQEPGWRLPTKEELLTLMDLIRKQARKNPYIDTTTFPDMLPTSPGRYWTSTRYGTDEAMMWCADFDLGVPSNCGPYPQPVRLVRASH